MASDPAKPAPDLAAFGPSPPPSNRETTALASSRKSHFNPPTETRTNFPPIDMGGPRGVEKWRPIQQSQRQIPPGLRRDGRAKVIVELRLSLHENRISIRQLRPEQTFPPLIWGGPRGVEKWRPIQQSQRQIPPRFGRRRRLQIAKQLRLSLHKICISCRQLKPEQTFPPLIWGGPRGVVK